jgi:hypothetical protein
LASVKAALGLLEAPISAQIRWPLSLNLQVNGLLAARLRDRDPSQVYLAKTGHRLGHQWGLFQRHGHDLSVSPEEKARACSVDAAP